MTEEHWMQLYLQAWNVVHRPEKSARWAIYFHMWKAMWCNSISGGTLTMSWYPACIYHSACVWL